MSPSVWMPWYIGDYLRDTTHLDHVQDGAYRRLIDSCWLRDNVLPDDDAQLARITKLPPKLWRTVRPVVAEFFTVDDSGWHHSRVERELEKARAITGARREGGKKTAMKRWGSTSSDEPPPASDNLSDQASNDSSDTAELVAEQPLSDLLSSRPSHPHPHPHPHPHKESSSLRSQRGRGFRGVVARISEQSRET